MAYPALPAEISRKTRQRIFAEDMRRWRHYVSTRILAGDDIPRPMRDHLDRLLQYGREAGFLNPTDLETR